MWNIGTKGKQILTLLNDSKLRNLHFTCICLKKLTVIWIPFKHEMIFLKLKANTFQIINHCRMSFLFGNRSSSKTFKPKKNKPICYSVQLETFYSLQLLIYNLKLVCFKHRLQVFMRSISLVKPWVPSLGCVCVCGFLYFFTYFI